MRRAPLALSLFYFAFFAAAGVYVPYLGLYTRGLGFTSLQIGLIASITPLSKALLPPLWGGLADQSGTRKFWILLTSAGSVFAFSFLFAAEAFPWVALTMAAYAFFHSPILALSETLSLEESARAGFAYGRVRVWGSVGYLAAVLGLGSVLDSTSMRSFVSGFVLLSLLQVLAGMGLPSTAPPPASRAARGVAEQLGRAPVLLFLLACTLMEVSHSAYGGFFAIHLSDAGYSRTAIGPISALPVFCEIGAMVFADGWLRRSGSRRLLGLSFAAAAARWALLASSSGLPVVIAAQTLHALTYGVFHVTAVHQIRKFFPAHLQASAQSLYIGVTYGVGGAIGLMAAGRFYDHFGGGVLFAASALIAAAGLPLALASVREAPGRDPEQAAGEVNRPIRPTQDEKLPG